MNHLDSDTLTDIGAALDWDLDRLDHVSECRVCQERLRDLGGMHASLGASLTPRAGFTETVLTTLPADPPAPPRLVGAGWAVVRGLCGAGIAVVTLGLAAAHGAPLEINVLVIGVVALTGAGLAWRWPMSAVAG